MKLSASYLSERDFTFQRNFGSSLSKSVDHKNMRWAMRAMCNRTSLARCITRWLFHILIHIAREVLLHIALIAHLMFLWSTDLLKELPKFLWNVKSLSERYEADN
jgi:hypothetical protein